MKYEEVMNQYSQLESLKIRQEVCKDNMILARELRKINEETKKTFKENEQFWKKQYWNASYIHEILLKEFYK